MRLSRHLIMTGAALAMALPSQTSMADDLSPDAPLARRGDSTYVVGGMPVAAGNWHDTVAVRAADGLTFCTGTLIAPNVVLTAGHCLEPATPSDPPPPIATSVMLKTNSLMVQGEVLPVVRRIAYPSWATSYDLGLLILGQPSTVPPRPLAHGCILDLYLKPQASAIIVGYGAVDKEGQTYVNELMQASTTITDPTCSAGAARGCNPLLAPDGELGAGGNGIDTCFGDSGGPIYLSTPRGDYLIGATSRGYNNVSTPCSEGGIYTRVDSETVRAWIEAEAGLNIQPTTCLLELTLSTPKLSVEAGSTGAVRFDITDPDASEQVAFAVVLAPTHGEAVVLEDGTVEYTPDPGYEGPDQFGVRVYDETVPTLSNIVAVTVEVTPASGCQSSGSSAVNAWLIAMAALVLARRRRSAR